MGSSLLAENEASLTVGLRRNLHSHAVAQTQFRLQDTPLLADGLLDGLLLVERIGYRFRADYWLFFLQHRSHYLLDAVLFTFLPR